MNWWTNHEVKSIVKRKQFEEAKSGRPSKKVEEEKEGNC